MKINNLITHIATGETDNSFVGIKIIGNHIHFYYPESYHFDTDNYDLFEEFVNIQRPSFVKALNKVNVIIERLKLEGKVSEYAVWKARIKHFENALKTFPYK